MTTTELSSKIARSLTAFCKHMKGKKACEKEHYTNDPEVILHIANPVVQLHNKIQ